MTVSPGLLGIAAGVLTTCAVIPQLIKTFRTRHAKDLSFWQLLILLAGMSLWLWYGLEIHDLPLIAANSFSLFCYSLLLILKVVYDRGDKTIRNDYPE